MDQSELGYSILVYRTYTPYDYSLSRHTRGDHVNGYEYHSSGRIYY
jgi:hypothetical protein